MGLDDKIKHAAEEGKGTAEEAWGKLTHDDKLVAEGKKDQAAADLKQAGDDVKDALH